jgi:hypothetical protein
MNSEELQHQREVELDALLFEICESLQLESSQHKKAEARYKAIANELDSDKSPFAEIETNLYPQGSMKLGTTVKPIDGPHDLDFVCEVAVEHTKVNPMALLREMYAFFQNHGVYGKMTSLKKRCVRIEYKDEFYLDILPACMDRQNGGNCIQVPDIQTKDWTPSNPIGYATWFNTMTRNALVKPPSRRYLAMDKAASVEPIPSQQNIDKKTVLQLVVQLMKRWRDIHYANSDFPPISIVLTTLAAGNYSGEPSLTGALLNVLDRIAQLLRAAKLQQRRIQVLNPVHEDEDFSERWKDNSRAYTEFETGMIKFADEWRAIALGPGNADKKIEAMFGEVVNTALIKRAKDLNSLRESGGLGIRNSGIIVPVVSAMTPMLRNTNYGKK